MNQKSRAADDKSESWGAQYGALEDGYSRDRTEVFNKLLKGRDARPIRGPLFSLEDIDEFLKEAYRINSHIAELNAYLKATREAYLSTAPRPIRTSKTTQSKFLTDRDKDEVDAEAKKTLRQLNAAVETLQAAEQIRQDTATRLLREKYRKLGGALLSWAAGGAGHTKSYDQEVEEAKNNTVSANRESMISYLRQKLKDCVMVQASMMEKRITRELEKRKSVLANAKFNVSEMSTFNASNYAPVSPTQTDSPHYIPDEELTAEQVQMFEEDHQDMLRHYENTLNQVTSAEKSLREISELQTQIMENLHVQNEMISHVVDDSLVMTDNVGGGNKELKKATERGSTAKYTFYGSCALCLFLVTWDLVF